MPVTINGRIDKPGDCDCFVFVGAAKQDVTLQVRARRLDSPLDSVLTLYKDGKQLSKNNNTDFGDEGEPLVTHARGFADHLDSPRRAITWRRWGRPEQGWAGIRLPVVDRIPGPGLWRAGALRRQSAAGRSRPVGGGVEPPRHAREVLGADPIGD